MWARTAWTRGATVLPPDSPRSTIIAIAAVGLSNGANAMIQVFLRLVSPRPISAVPVLPAHVTFRLNLRFFSEPSAASSQRVRMRRPVPLSTTSRMPSRTRVMDSRSYGMVRAGFGGGSPSLRAKR